MVCALESNSTEMANLNNENWREIDDRIKKATSVRWLQWFKTYGTAGAFITACVAVAIFVAAQIFGNSKFQGVTEEHLKGIDSQLVSIRALIGANQPLKSANQAAAKDLLTQARQGKVPPIPGEIVDQAGRSFAEAGSSSPAAWDVALQYVNYRSVLNRDLKSVRDAKQIATTPTPAYLGAHYKAILDAAYLATTVITRGGKVPLNRAATMHELGGSNPDEGQEYGAEVILVTGAHIILDNSFLKHVVIKDSTVFYHGQHVQLVDVTFADCTFVIEDNAEGHAFADAVLAKSPTEFQLTKI
jgi:hypothetical protein